MEIKVGYALNGTLNGAVVGVRGTGEIEGQSGKLELALDESPVSHPPHWDPVLVVVGCMDGLILASAPMGAKASADRLAWLFGADDIPVHFDTRVTVYNDDSREVGTAVVSLVLLRGGDSDGDDGIAALDLRAQLVEARFRLLPMERVTHFETPARINVMQASDDSPWTVMTTAWTFETNFGNSYRAVATSSFEAGDTGLSIASISIDCEFARGSEGGVSLTATCG